jgi:hypothetical protein
MKYIGFLSLLQPFLLQRAVAQNSYDDLALYKAAALHPNATRSVIFNWGEYDKQAVGWGRAGGVDSSNQHHRSIWNGRCGWAASLQLCDGVTSFNSHGAFVANSSWDARNAIVRGWKDNGDCVATFGQQCEGDWIRAISQARASAPNHNASISVCGDMIIPSIPPSCQGLFMVATISHSTSLASHLRTWV